MAAGTPLNRLVLVARSVADDLGYAALADVARALEGVTEDYRIIGGHMVTMLAARWQLGAELYRETGDVDLGVPPVVARDSGVVAFAAGVTSADFRGGIKAESAARIRDLFSSRRSPGMINLAAGLRLPAKSADERFTRIRALVDRILGPA